MKRMISGVIMGAFLTLMVLATPNPMTASLTNLSANAASSSIYRQLDLFGDVFEQVRMKYVDKVDDAELMEAAIDGMLTSLDPHSSYLNPEEYSDMEVSTSGEFGGLGIEVQSEDGLIRVVSPIDDTPASRAGIIAGDLISHINGESIMDLSMNEAIDLMRGPEGSEITITVLRDTQKPFDVTLKRAIIAKGIHKAMASLNKSLGKDMAGIILDLRSNPGGLLDQAVAVTDAFLERGEIVSTSGRKTRDSQRYNASSRDLSDGRPIVILINGGSASAAEIVAGALQDHRRATLIGTKSFGKGSVQTVIPLNNGRDGALRLTTAKYYTPSGRSIHNTGIEPDIKVEFPIPEAPVEGEEPVEIEDIQLDRAIEVLREMVDGGQKSASIAP
jgi:carboxyl-terminal processing protease